MNVRYIKNREKVKRAATYCLVGVMAGMFCMHQQCLAQQSFQPSAGITDPLKQINWILGPRMITIGNYADINIPDGYRFADGNGARVVLDSENATVPNDVIGILTENSGKSFAILEYAPRGYVKNVDLSQINTTTVLKAAQNQLQTDDSGHAATTLNWQSQPAYDPQTHSLAWALQVQTPSAKVLNETVALLGRHGVMEITAAWPYPLTDTSFLQQLVSNITFKEGERYSDYQPGDKVAEIGLAELITGQNQVNAAGGFTGVTAAWVYSILALLLLGGLIVLREKNRRDPARAQVPVAATADYASGVKPLPVLHNGELNGNGSKTVLAASPASKQTHNNRRKRIFDYPRFYTNVMNELSYHTYGGNSLPLHSKSTNGNGHHNGHNGHNGHTNGHVNGTNGSGLNETIKAGIEELIQTQKSLIQEQKCLLEQQTRLIEQKRWLIEEQTAFFKGQSNMINEQQFPLKFE